MLALAVGALSLGSAYGQTIYGLRSNNALVSFAVATPGTVTAVGTISGITAGQTLVGMDFRPATGELVALGYDQATTSARLYVIDRTTAVATPLGAAAFTIDLGTESPGNIGLDFNPTVDRIRVVAASNNANWRLNPVTGGLVDGDLVAPGIQPDGNLNYAPGDLNAGRNPDVSAVAYTNSFLGAVTTTLFDADLLPNTPTPGSTRVILSIQNPPNGGVLNTSNTDSQGNLVDLDFDIYNDLATGVQTGYAVGAYNAGGFGFVNALGIIDFNTATIANQGAVGAPVPSANPIIDIAVFIDRTAPAVTGEIAWALQNTVLPAVPAFVTFDTDNPTFIRGLRQITGLTAGQNVVGFDSRPATGALVVVGYNAGTNEVQVYNVVPSTGVATAVGPAIVLPLGSGNIAVDFNPVPDRIRVLSATGDSYRLNPNDGTLSGTDTDPAYQAGDPNFGQPAAVGSAAYTNSFGGSGSTLLYGIDEPQNDLVTFVGNPNAGVLSTVGPLSITLNPADRSVDLDIKFEPSGVPSNTAYLVANTGSSTNDFLYTLNLSSGVATEIGRIGGGIPLRDLAIRLPVALTWNGSQSTNWNLNTNWTPNGVPEQLTNVTVPGELTRYPVITGSGEANLLVINLGASVTIDPLTEFSLNSNLTNNGIFDAARTSSTTLIKPSSQILGGSGTTTFGNVRVRNVAGAALDVAGSGARVRGVLGLDGSLTTNGRPFTLLSDAAGTAMVTNDGGVVVGAATVQRYITSTAPGITGLGYRHLSAPVSNTTFGDLATTAPNFTPVVNGAYNIPANPGSTVPYPTVFGYNESRFPASADFLQGYFSPTSLSDPMIPGRGYSVYMPGTAKPDFVGTLGNGDVVVSNLTRTGNFSGNTQKSGWHLLGNPYPAPIDWDLVTIPAGMSPSISVVRTTGGGGGIYTTRVNGVGPAGADLVGMAQGFFARVTSPGVTFTFTNAARLTSYANPNVFRGAADSRPTAHLTLRRADQPMDDADAAYVYFQDGATPAFEDGMDGLKLRSEGPAASIFTLANGEELAINGLPATAAGAATVALGIITPELGTYELSAAALSAFAPGTDISLIDRATGTTYDLNQQSTVRFTATHTGADLTRFALRFGRGSAVTAASTLSLDVYPNPVGNASGAGLTVTALGIGQGNSATVVLYDALGRSVLRHTLAVTAQSASAVLNTRALAPGTYTLRFLTADGQPLTRQVVVQ